jgi:glycosyltransferase involved in cell wall biosynthesis
MRILIIHCAYQHVGGEDVIVSEEIDLLRLKGNEVELLLFSNTLNPAFNLLQLPFNIKSYIATEKKISEFKPDVVHIHNLHFGGSTSVLYAIKKRAAIVYTLHNYRLICPSGTLFNRGKLYLRSLKSSFPWGAMFDKVYKKSLPLTTWLSMVIWFNNITGVWKLVNRFIVLTDHSKKVIESSKLSLTSNQLVIKPNFTGSDKPENQDRSNNFLFVGRLSEEKGIKVLLNAFTNSDELLTIIGDGPFRQQVEEASAANLNITYLGFQGKDFISDAMQRCTALIFPSIWYETFGLTIIEAFAMSTPVIAANIGSASSLINHFYNGLHFEPDDVNSLKHSLKTWHNYSASKKHKFQNNARQTYEQYYTPDNNYEQLISIYNQAIDDNKGPRA